MPFDAMILSAAILVVFVVFGLVLYWSERRTRDMSAMAESGKIKHRGF